MSHLLRSILSILLSTPGGALCRCGVSLGCCYDLGASLRKRNDLQGKDGSTSALRNLTNGSAQTDVENNVGRTRTGGFKGQP